jgi:hypothetical protein
MTDGGEGYLGMNKKEKSKRAKRLTEYNKTKKDYLFTQSKEYKNKMSKATKGKGCKKVINTKNGFIYNSLSEASKDVSIHYTTLSSMLNNKKPNKTDLKWI